MKQVTRLHQIEITSNCNLRCKYCAHPKMPRAKMDMADEVFDRALWLVAHFVKHHAQVDVNLAGIGESTIHPKFMEFVARARKALPDIDLTMATNGVNMTDEIAACLREYRVRTWVSLHRPEKAGIAVEILKKHGVLAGVSADPSVAAVNWAGQVAWHVSAPKIACMWQRDGMAIAWADGRIGSCSLDGQGADGALGTVWDDPSTLFTKPYSLCKDCHMTIQ